MDIKQSSFLKSSSKLHELPPAEKPEYAFIGRSNVGKSSLINSLTHRKNLALTSGTPGKTRLMNHFEINETWYLVDLPGYGYARISKTERAKFEVMIREYLTRRVNLMNVFVLVDSRHEPQKLDLEFMEFLGISRLPFTLVFTKIDKLRPVALENNLAKYKETLLKTWEELPPMVLTSAVDKRGREEVLQLIEEYNQIFFHETRQ